MTLKHRKDDEKHVRHTLARFTTPKTQMALRKSLLSLFPFLSSLLSFFPIHTRFFEKQFLPFCLRCLLFARYGAGIICFIQRPVKSFEVIPRQLME